MFIKLHINLVFKLPNVLTVRYSNTFEIVNYSFFCAYYILLYVFYVAHSMAVLRIGSMEVGALLNDAYKEFEVINT